MKLPFGKALEHSFASSSVAIAIILIGGSIASSAQDSTAVQRAIVDPPAELMQVSAPATTPTAVPAAPQPTLVALDATPAKPKKPKKAVSAPVPAGKGMDAQAVTKMYLGKTWVWPEGGGYFGPDKSLVAWSGAGDKATYAEGKWYVTSLGTLCMRATWFTHKKGSPNLTCFEHRVDGMTILQKKLGAGSWYTFRSAPEVPTDEFAKLKDGDLVSEHLTALKLSSDTK